MTTEFVVDWERDIYGRGKQLNRWPFSEVVSAVMNATSGEDRTAMRFLEIGCGAGNNVWFAAVSGFQTAGLDLSPTAIEFARARLSELGHAADLRVGNLTALPWEDGVFDIVLDRGALTQNTYKDIRVALREVRRVLRPGGRFFAFSLFGTEDPDRRFGTQVSHNTFDHFTDGFFALVGLTSFFDRVELRNLFAEFREVAIQRHLTEDEQGNLRSEHYSITCVR